MKNRKHIQPISMYLTFILSFLLAACASEPVVSPAAEPTRDPELERSIVQQLEEMNPEALPVYREATEAMDSGDLEKSKGLYEQVLSMAPEFATAYRRLSYIQAYEDNLEGAESLARKALEFEPNEYNQIALAEVLIYKGTPKDSQEAFNLASSAIAVRPEDEKTMMVYVMAAGAVDRLDEARQVNERLLQLAPANPFAHYYAAIFAAIDGRWLKAEEELMISQQLGMPAEAVQSALDNGIARNALFAKALRWSAFGMAAWLFGLGILYLLGSFLSRATIQALAKSEPVVNARVLPQERRIRSIYRFVINILSLYFYVSIPFIILALFLVVGGAFYLFFLIGSIPIQLAFILVIMLLVSLYAIARSIFSRIKDLPPGRELSRRDAPELWALVEDVACTLKIRPVDAIYITPFIGIAVYENGSILKKLRGAGKRNLLLGMGVLPSLTQGQLAAILAHEYGHFSNQDTAGGDLAYQVYASLTQMAEGLIRAGSTQFYNPAWLFILGYQRIFLRVSLGASRLQEVLADRYAALAYGGQNFIEGLKNVIRQGIAFPLQADEEIRKFFEQKQPVHNLYNLQMQESLQGELDKQYEELMNRPTSEYDSHPAPQERIQWIERLRAPYSPLQDNPRPALHLFPNPEALQVELTAELMSRVQMA